MNEKYLPIGTVVLLKEGKKKLMITGFLYTPSNELNKVYDYCGCLYPEGVLTLDKTILFNHDQIDRIFHMGMKDEEGEKFTQNLKEFFNQRKNTQE